MTYKLLKQLTHDLQHLQTFTNYLQILKMSYNLLTHELLNLQILTNYKNLQVPTNYLRDLQIL